MNRGRNNDKPKDLVLGTKKLMKYLHRFMPVIIIAFIVSALGSVLSIIGPNKLSELTDIITEGLLTGIDLKAVANISLFLLILYLFSALFNFISGFIMATVANKFARELREKISKKINKLPLKYFDEHSYGDILSRVTNDVDTIGQSMNQSLASLIGAITLFIGTVIMMFVTNWVMALTAIISSLIGFIFMFAIMARSQKYFTLRQTELGELNDHIEEIYSSLNVVKAYNAKESASEEFNKLDESVYNANLKSQFLSGLMQPIMSFIGNFGYLAVCIVGAILAINGQYYIWCNCSFHDLCKIIYESTYSNCPRSD